MRMIDADALPVDAFLNTKMVLQTDIDNAPTIDAVPVVRCKDCQNWEAHLFGADGDCYCPFVDHYTTGDWFCADGERKDDEAD